jgi:dUTP pyrophosphatase
MKITMMRLDPDIRVPEPAHPGDAGVDLQAREGAALPAGGRAVVPTGVAVAIPEGYVGLVVPRSGLAAKSGVGVVNAPGIVDAGYRGEIKVILVNHGSHQVLIGRGDRIAQLVIVPFVTPRFEEVEDLDDSTRGDAGFGSTGR